MLDAFMGKSDKGLPYMLEEAANAMAIRRGHWKYIEFRASKYRPKPGPAELYDLSTDIAEVKNIISEHPQIAESLRKQLQSLQKSEGIRQ